jgi:hypothetical protein
MELRKIVDDVYMVQHPTGSSNSMFVVTDEGVVVWDSDSEPQANTGRYCDAGPRSARKLL